MQERELGFMRWVDIITALLLVLGGITLGVGGLIGFTPITTFLTNLGVYSRIISVLIGLSALYEISSMWRAIPRRWGCTLPGETPHPAHS